MENKAIFLPTAGMVATWTVQPETATLMISPCRSGSTAMLRVFGHGGAAAYFQPIKNAYRWAQMGEYRPWTPPTDGKPLFVKETFGPYQRFETGFDPLQDLTSAGLELARLRLVVLLRDPGMVWASWRSVWPKSARLDLLAQAYRACLTCVASARQLGVPVAQLGYEASANDPTAALGPLFAAMGLGPVEAALQDWPKRAGFGAAGSGVVLPQEPADYITQGAHDPVIQAVGFGALPPRATLTPDERAQIARCGIAQSHAALTQLPTEFAP